MKVIFLLIHYGIFRFQEPGTARSAASPSSFPIPFNTKILWQCRERRRKEGRSYVPGDVLLGPRSSSLTVSTLLPGSATRSQDVWRVRGRVPPQATRQC
uniref:Uncharacterized protein n=1 Tax=Arundo donax TaxID=35708 RepID=A0A0A9S5R3_ARUDO